MIVQPYALSTSSIGSDYQTDTSSRPHLIQTMQAISGSIAIAIAIDRCVIKNRLIHTFLAATIGFTAGLLVKKCVSVYTLFPHFDQFLIERSEQYPYAYGIAMATAACISLVFPHIGQFLTFGLGMLPGYFFEVHMGN